MRKKGSTRRQFVSKLMLACSGIMSVSCSRKISDYKNLSLGIIEKFFNKLEEWSALYQEDRERRGGRKKSYKIPTESEYRDYLTTLKLKHFHPDEIIRPHRNTERGVTNHIPPKHLWPDIVSTLRTIDELRERLGAKCTPLSVYRSQEYNTAIGGASRSQHMRNKAIDVKFACGSDKAFAEALKMREEGFFQGGIGWYAGFIHIDTRGYDSTWGKDNIAG